MTLYHGSKDIVEYPEIRKARFNKDFYFGFYCTNIEKQAERWATRYGEKGYINRYEYTENTELKILRFEKMTEEWLDFIISCRSGQAHQYDIVEGPMADDQIWNYVEEFMNGHISRNAFWELVKFNYPTHQIVFFNQQALACIRFEGSDKL